MALFIPDNDKAAGRVTKTSRLVLMSVIILVGWRDSDAD